MKTTSPEGVSTAIFEICEPEPTSWRDHSEVPIGGAAMPSGGWLSRRYSNPPYMLFLALQGINDSIIPGPGFGPSRWTTDLEPAAWKIQSVGSTRTAVTCLRLPAFRCTRLPER